jgi:hypothetical protein
MVGRIKNRKPVIGLKNGVYTRFNEHKEIEETEIVYCGYCGKEIEEPRKEKGKVVQKFCNRICKGRFHNLKRYTMVKQFMDFLAKSGFLAVPPSEGRK